MSQHVFNNYASKVGVYDELQDTKGAVRESYEILYSQFENYNNNDFEKLIEAANLCFLNEGITFSVYSEKDKGSERIFPFDLLPRIIPKDEWEHIEKGVIQRNLAINMFLKDIYF